MNNGSMMTTAQALDESITSWKCRLKLTIEDIRNEREAPLPANCALCSLYYNNNCEGCPVQNKTGYGLCLRTPFKEAADLYWEIYHGIPCAIKTFYKAVQKEIKFLESLR